MNSIDGDLPVVGGRVLSVAEDGRVLVDGLRPVAGDGIARALARLVVEDVPGDAAETAIAVDQTNTSLIVDGRLVVKVVGRWAAADRAGELLAMLAAAGSADVAPVHGRIAWRHPTLGESTLAVVTGYLPGAADGWTWAVDDVVATLEGAAEPDWPGTLGQIVARVHDVLAAAAQPAEPDAPALRRQRAEATLAAALAATAGPTRNRLRNRRSALEHGIRSLVATSPGLEFPIHGDLHVGQVLASPDAAGGRRYTVIDFDGDPQLAASDRERPDAAARDVAHLLVSFDLVAAVAQRRLGRADAAAWRWADRARAAFLGAYLEGLQRDGLFDAALLPAFEAEQLTAELLYADRFLPVWRYAPDAAITHRYPSTNELPEVPWTPPPSDPTSN